MWRESEAAGSQPWVDSQLITSTNLKPRGAPWKYVLWPLLGYPH